MSDVKAAVGEEKYEQFRSLIQSTFPGSPPPDDATVDGFVYAIGRQDPDRLAEAGIPSLPPDPHPPESETPERGIGGPSFPLFIAHATHHRVQSMTEPKLGQRSGIPFESEFVGHLPVVRVPLPAFFVPGTNPCIKTQIGDVFLSSDHLVGSVDLVAQKFKEQLGYYPAKVDLVTPARTGITRARFGAIAMYLGYKNAADAGPSFFIFEAGMATGEAKMLYLGKTLDTEILQRSGYDPTAYSSHNNFYRGGVTVKGHVLSSMWVQGGPEKGAYYIQVSVNYLPTTDTSNDPLGLLLEAAKRIALIGQKMHAASGIDGESIMAGLAGMLNWVVKPGFGGPGSSSRSLGAPEGSEEPEGQGEQA